MTYLDILKAQLPIDEGVKAKPYRDSEGILTIGCGRNLEHNGLRKDEIDLMLANDIDQAEADARALFHVFDRLSENRKAVLVNMSFNLGKNRLSGFRKFITAVNTGNFEQAAVEMLDSKWAVQVGNRAKRLATMMTEG